MSEYGRFVPRLRIGYILEGVFTPESAGTLLVELQDHGIKARLGRRNDNGELMLRVWNPDDHVLEINVWDRLYLDSFFGRVYVHKLPNIVPCSLTNESALLVARARVKRLSQVKEWELSPADKAELYILKGLLSEHDREEGDSE